MSSRRSLRGEGERRRHAQDRSVTGIDRLRRAAHNTNRCATSRQNSRSSIRSSRSGFVPRCRTRRTALRRACASHRSCARTRWRRYRLRSPSWSCRRPSSSLRCQARGSRRRSHDAASSGLSTLRSGRPSPPLWARRFSRSSRPPAPRSRASRNRPARPRARRRAVARRSPARRRPRTLRPRSRADWCSTGIPWTTRDFYDVVVVAGGARRDFWPAGNHLALGRGDAEAGVPIRWYVYPAYRVGGVVQFGKLHAQGQETAILP